MNTTEIRQIVRRAIQKGWLRTAAMSHVRNKTREVWAANGLNAQGKPLLYKKRPQLSGLKDNEYHRRYSKMARAGVFNLQTDN